MEKWALTGDDGARWKFALAVTSCDLVLRSTAREKTPAIGINMRSKLPVSVERRRTMHAVRPRKVLLNRPRRAQSRLRE